MRVEIQGLTATMVGLFDDSTSLTSSGKVRYWKSKHTEYVNLHISDYLGEVERVNKMLKIINPGGY